MALAVVLLTGAGLLIRSFVELTGVNPGFRPESALSFRVVLQGESYDGQQIRARVNTLIERLESLPGVVSAGAATVLPMSGRGSLVGFEVEGVPTPPDVNAEIAMASVTPGYFRAIGTPLISGRELSDQDVADAPLVVVINQAGARFWFPGEDPVGRRIQAAGALREIVGVTGDVLQIAPGQPAAPQVFAPLMQRATRSVRFVVRTTGDPLLLATAIRGEVRSLDPNLPVAQMAPLTELMAASLARPRFYTSLLTLFAGLALALAATGIFGVMSYSVAQRTREISIRMALGAESRGVIRMVVSQAMILAVSGVAIGIVCALALGRLLSSQLFGVTVFDPVTLGAVVTVLVGSALLASYIPARRAAGVDPLVALRES